MRESLVAGIRRIEHTAVDESNAISFLGDGLRVYSTPPMVHAVEYACFRLIGEHLESGETSLGIHVAMDHLGATPIGHRVEIAVTVRSVEGHKVTLDAEVRDAVEVVGRGTHVRVVTDVERFRPKVETKRERLDAAGAERANPHGNASWPGDADSRAGGRIRAPGRSSPLPGATARTRSESRSTPGARAPPRRAR